MIMHANVGMSSMGGGVGVAGMSSMPGMHMPGLAGPSGSGGHAAMKRKAGDETSPTNETQPPPPKRGGGRKRSTRPPPPP